MSRRIDELDEIVRQWDLNAHPFYQAWRAGTLPVERLAAYAAEWAPFIGMLDQGWDRIGEPANVVRAGRPRSSGSDGIEP